MNVVACLCERLRWRLVFDVPIRRTCALVESDTQAAGARNRPWQIVKVAKKGT